MCISYSFCLKPFTAGFAGFREALTFYMALESYDPVIDNIAMVLLLICAMSHLDTQQQFQIKHYE